MIFGALKFLNRSDAGRITRTIEAMLNIESTNVCPYSHSHAMQCLMVVAKAAVGPVFCKELVIDPKEQIPFRTHHHTVPAGKEFRNARLSFCWRLFW
jgi:hypothetical protein